MASMKTAQAVGGVGSLARLSDREMRAHNESAVRMMFITWGKRDCIATLSLSGKAGGES